MILCNIVNEWWGAIVLSVVAAIVFAVISKLFAFGTRRKIRLILDDMKNLQGEFMATQSQYDYGELLNTINKLGEKIQEIYSEIRLFTFFFNYRKKRLIYLYLCNLRVFVMISNSIPYDMDDPKGLADKIANNILFEIKGRVYSWVDVNIQIIRCLLERKSVRKCFQLMMLDDKMKKDIDVFEFPSMPKFDEEVLCELLKRMVSPFACGVSSYSSKTIPKRRYDYLIEKYYDMPHSPIKYKELSYETQWYVEQSVSLEVAIAIYKNIELERKRYYDEYCKQIKLVLGRKNNIEVRSYLYGRNIVMMVYMPKGKIYSCHIREFQNNGMSFV